MARYLSLLVVIPCLLSTVAMAEEEQPVTEQPLTYSQKTQNIMESDAGAAFNIGWRYPITAERDKSGYFVGAFLGHVIAASSSGGDYNRNGAGLDISYQWVNEHTRKTVSVGMGSGFSRKLDGGAKDGVPAAPRVFISFNTALKMF